MAHAAHTQRLIVLPLFLMEQKENIEIFHYEIIANERQFVVFFRPFAGGPSNSRVAKANHEPPNGESREHKTAKTVYGIVAAVRGNK